MTWLLWDREAGVFREPNAHTNTSEPVASDGESSIITTHEVGSHLLTSIERQSHGGIAFQQWPAGRVLAKYIAGHPQLVTGMRVLELGSGCGLAGLTAAAVGAQQVVLTDIPDAIEHLNVNIRANRQSARIPEGVVKAQVLEWGDEDALAALQADYREGFQVLLLSDCTYWRHLFKPLLNTVKWLAENCSLRGEMRIMLAHTWRSEENEKVFFSDADFTFERTTLEREGHIELMQLMMSADDSNH